MIVFFALATGIQAAFIIGIQVSYPFRPPGSSTMTIKRLLIILSDFRDAQTLETC